MPNTLPFFKNYPADWLLSEKIATMMLHEIGAYKLLIDHQWMGEQCTLPDDLSRLKALARWRDELHGDFTKVLTCFPVIRSRRGRRGNARLLAVYMEAIARQESAVLNGQKGAERRWAKPTTTRKQTRTQTQPVDWLAQLKAMPIYTHINWDREMGKIEVWRSRPENAHRVINHKFVTNWMNKIEPPLSNGHATTHCPTCNKDYTDALALRIHTQTYHPKFEG